MNAASKTRADALTPLHLRPRQAAARHGVSISWLWSAVAAGKIGRPRKLTRRISLFTTEKLDREVAALLARTDELGEK